MFAMLPRQKPATPSSLTMPFRHAIDEPPYLAASVIIWKRSRSSGATAVREIAAEIAPA